MVSVEAEQLVEQVTLHKLEFVRAFLKEKNLPHVGKRADIRQTCLDLLENDGLDFEELKGFLEPLELWGSQRIRLLRLPLEVLSGFQTGEDIQARLNRVSMGSIWQEEIPLLIPTEISPLAVRFRDDSGRKTLTLIAGKIREIWLSQPDIPITESADHPGIIYRPFKREFQKALSFAEIELNSGHTMISVSLMKNATTGYITEFEEFSDCFSEVLSFEIGARIDLRNAVRNIYSATNADILIHDQRNRSDFGGIASFRSHNRNYDVRQDPQLHVAKENLGEQADGEFCNCYWQTTPELAEMVHTALYAAQGEVSFYGQLREESVRHVLQRIEHINQ